MLVDHGARLIRINPNEPAVPTPKDVLVAAPAGVARQVLAAALTARS